jgi:hypothetical protein
VVELFIQYNGRSSVIMGTEVKRSYKIKYCILIGIICIIYICLFKVLEIKEVSIDKINESISDNIDISIMDKGDVTKLKNLYHINQNEIDNFILYAPKTNMEANEILVLKPKENNSEELIEKINKRVEKQSNSFKDYRPEEYEIIKEHVIEQKDNYLILIISKDSGTIKEAINNNF